MAITPDELRATLHGVIAFPVTPFRADLSLDEDGLRRNLQLLLQHPICAIVAPGGTGEIYSLTPAEHLAVVKITVEEAGRVPVIAGAAFNPALGVQLARQAADAGASGILAFPPYYPHPEADGMIDYYRAIGEATPLGMLIYSRDWFHPDPRLVERIAGAVKTLIAWKDGQGDIRRLQAIMQRLGGRLHWIGGAGDDMVPAYYSLGIRTYTSSVANLSPAVSQELHELASKGESARLSQLMREAVLPLYALRARRKGYEVSAMKVLMDMMGASGGTVRPPLVMPTAEECEELRAMLPHWTVPVGAGPAGAGAAKG